jgi:hypothetical protein
MIPRTPAGSSADRIRRIVSYLPELREGQLTWIERIVLQFRRPKEFWANPSSDFVTECFLEDFGDALRLHHCFSDDAFAKDKFEYTSVRVWQQCGISAAMAPRGNPGHDISVGTERISLKTQADRNLRLNEIRLHKFMELGKGSWTDKPTDLIPLLNQFLHHLEGYDRILVLRNTGNPTPASPYWCYELVEIPVQLFQQAATGELEMMTDSKQMPKPGYCRVFDAAGQLAFRLYFDGGTERKLQVHKIRKDLCVVHAEWKFIVNELDEA